MTTATTTTTAPVRLERPASVTDALLARLVARVSSDGSIAPWHLTEVYTGEKLVELLQSGRHRARVRRGPLGPGAVGASQRRGPAEGL